MGDKMAGLMGLPYRQYYDQRCLQAHTPARCLCCEDEMEIIQKEGMMYIDTDPVRMQRSATHRSQSFDFHGELVWWANLGPKSINLSGQICTLWIKGNIAGSNWDDQGKILAYFKSL